LLKVLYALVENYIINLRCLSEGKLLSVQPAPIESIHPPTTLTMSNPSTPTALSPSTQASKEPSTSYNSFQPHNDSFPPPPTTELIYTVLQNPPIGNGSARSNNNITGYQLADLNVTSSGLRELPRHSTTNDLSIENALSDLALSQIHTPTSVESMPLMTYPSTKDDIVPATSDEGYDEESYATVRRNERAQ
jgi:hypothetical protein